jgi:spore coat polysaccharide biosynthesis protein SpsF (cytidylyltransferase family)
MNLFQIKLKKKYEKINFGNLHLSLDTEDDYILIKEIITVLGDKVFTVDDVLEYLNNK